jgi:iron complex transport system permease protein
MSLSASGPLFVLSLMLVGALLLNIGVGAVAVQPNQILYIVWSHMSGKMTSLPGWEVIAAGWDGFLELPLVGEIAAWIDAHTGWLQAWLTPGVTRQQDAVVWAIRIPRTLLGGIIGCGLAVSGAAMQGVFRNALADPGLIGVSSGAALGAVTSIVLEIAWFGIWTLPFFAFVSGLIVTFVVYLIARAEGRTEVVTLLLAGVALNAIAGAAVGLLISVATDQQLRSVTFWTLGSLGGAQWIHVGIVGLVTAIGVAIVMRFRGALNLFVLGEREARHLGVRVEQVRITLIFITAAMTGAAVAFAGAIGFVGLVVPHLIRLWIGPDHRRLLPLCAVAGATLMLLADLASRNLAAPTEFPIGVTMSIVGGPFFIWLLLRTRRQQGGWG